MIRLKIGGMTCGHCRAAVEKALAQVPGVGRVHEVSLERGEATIEGDASREALVAAVESQGYEARAA